MASLVLKSLFKSFDSKHTILRDISFEVKDGEFVSILGPSGCGKSTLLRIIAGLETIDSGDLLFDGNKVNHLSPQKRNIAMVFQDYALYPHMTVSNNITLSLKERRMPKDEIERRLGDISRLLRISHLLDRKPRQLSGGQRQRVAIGRALVRNPVVFLYDEPLSNLDENLRDEMRKEIASLHRKVKTTTIYVTHHQEEAVTLSDRIVVLKDGVIQQMDAPEAIYNRPANVFVAQFIGRPRMNLLKTKVVRENGRVVFRCPSELPGMFSVPETAIPYQLLAGIVGKEVILGVRPSEIGFSDAVRSGPHGLIETSFVNREFFGDEVFVEYVLGKQVFIQKVSRAHESVSRAPANSAEPVSLIFDPAKLFLFDAATEKRLS